MAIPPRKIRNLPPALPASDDDVFAVSQMGEDGVATTRRMTRKQFQDDILKVVTAARQQLVDLANQSHEDIFERLDAVEAKEPLKWEDVASKPSQFPPVPHTH